MKKLMLTLTLLLSIVVSCQFSVVSCGYADIPHLIRYQGTAVDTEGIPLEGPYNITFRIYTVEAGGTSIWEETHDQIPISKGTFSVLLGNSGSPLDLPFDTDYYLSIEISTDGEMTPRQRITSVGYAYRAETADLATEAEIAHSSQAVGGYDIATEHSPASQIYISSPDGYLPEVVDAGSIKDSSITNSKIANSTINLSSKTTGTLPIEHGGTGTTQSRYCNLGLNTTGILPIQYGGTGSNQQTYCDLNLNTSGILPKEKGGTGNTTGNVALGNATGTLVAAKGGTGLATKMIRVITYVGDGNDNRTVAHGLGTAPTFVVISRADTTHVTATLWMTGFTATYSKAFTAGSMHYEEIKSVDATNVTLGTSGDVNASAAPYSMLCIVGQ